MSTIICIVGVDGEVSRCDAKCYAATVPRCRCVCGGLNHGKGITVALAQTRELAEQLSSAGGAPCKIEVHEGADQETFPWATNDERTDSSSD